MTLPEPAHGLPTADRERLRVCLAPFPEIVFAVLYGSAVDGAVFRDVDVAVMLAEAGGNGRGQLELWHMLSEAMSQAISLPVDVRFLNDAPLPFRYNVSRGEPLLVRDDEAWFAFLERTWDMYLDFEPVAMQYLKEMAGSVGERE
ncbi:MAG: hypothetical protein KC425_09575 [Anaerolineales bacterium]|nr:hypothetical protein [Anaerolineales bacterium]